MYGSMLTFFSAAVFAQETPPPPVYAWDVLLWHVILVVVYVVLGLALFAVCYVIIDKATPFSLHKVLLEEKNNAVAIVLGAVFLGIALILAAAIRG